MSRPELWQETYDRGHLEELHIWHFNDSKVSRRSFEGNEPPWLSFYWHGEPAGEVKIVLWQLDYFAAGATQVFRIFYSLNWNDKWTSDRESGATDQVQNKNTTVNIFIKQENIRNWPLIAKKLRQ